MTIGNIEKYITDKAFEMGWRPDMAPRWSRPEAGRRHWRGPAAGLAAAHVLDANGVTPVVFDKYPEIGGLLHLRHPSFKLEKEVMQRRREIFEGDGSEFRLETEVGRTSPSPICWRVRCGLPWRWDLSVNARRAGKRRRRWRVRSAAVPYRQHQTVNGLW
ncbi:hypothetical protein ACNKHQ_18735 [Shigella flexneri]